MRAQLDIVAGVGSNAAMEPTYTIFRNGSQLAIAAEHVLASDLVLTTRGTWEQASSCEPFASRLRPPARPAPELFWLTLGRLALGSLATTAGALVFYKLGQAALDEEFDSVEFPAWVRAELIEAHVERLGSWCPRCRRSVPRSALTVDHIVSLRNGGKTSRANGQVICWSCNSAKGARNSILDYLRGR